MNNRESKIPAVITTVGIRVGAILIGVLLWQIIYLLVRNPEVFPSVKDVTANFSSLTSGSFLMDLAATILRSIVACGVAAVIMVPLGIATGLSRPLALLLSPLADFIRSLPGWV